MAENDVNRLIDMLYERVEDAKSPALKPNLSMAVSYTHLTLPTILRV